MFAFAVTLLFAANARASDMCALSILFYGPVYLVVVVSTLACAIFIKEPATLGVTIVITTMIGAGTIVNIVMEYIVGDFGEHAALRNFGIFFIATIVGVNAVLWARLLRLRRAAPSDDAARQVDE